MSNKHQAIIDFMLQCPVIRDNPLFFNAIQASDNSKEIVTDATDVQLETPFIDGSVLKRYSYTIIDFRSMSYNPVPINTVVPETTTHTDYVAENVQDLLDVQSIIEWVKLQKKLENFPDFGLDCIIDDLKTTSEIPNLNGVDTSVTPALGKYSITIQVDYIDLSEKIFK